ncbi:hypothetical protein Vretimale_10125 [Volvox reticuliferus]|uniref:Uncharacterized protein n=1 Tax=Volvox reticuliferus TaxID=1737510 RepID=A0A8J4GEK7_9CHLO|nr:hypothetical protein Vretimale_10125 [Volvox reticuliferus]
MAGLYSDSENDYCMLESPRPSAQARLAAAMIQGQLTELVLRGEVHLPRSIALCLEVLGLGTSPPEHQRAASKELVRLVTHRKLRPAVDNLLVMRRLCRIIGLTESATALKQAGQALFAVADDTAWQTKGGGAVDILREALTRCVDTIGNVAKTAVMVQDGAESGTQQPATSEAALSMDADQTALAVAAAVLLRPPVLHLLSTAQLVEAARALAACIASGRIDGNILAALTAVVKHGPTDEDRVEVGEAALGCQGMVAALLKVVASGTQAISLSRDAEVSSGCGEGASGSGDGASDAPVDGSGSDGDAVAACSGATPIQLTTSAQDAFSCLKHVLDACTAKRQCITAAVALDEATAALLPLLQLAPDEAARALHALLILTALSAPAGVCPDVKPVIAAFETSKGRQQVAPAAVLSAASTLLKDGAARDYSDQVCATALLHLTAALLEEDKLTVKQLHGAAAGLIAAASGVILGKAPEMTWCGLFTPVNGPIGSAPATGTHYPEALRLAAAELAFRILEWASVFWQDDDYKDNPLWAKIDSLLRPADIVNALIASLPLNKTAPAEQVSTLLSSRQAWCLVYSMCFFRPQPMWVALNVSGLTKMIKTLKGALKSSTLFEQEFAFQREVLQLAIMTVMCLWSGAISYGTTSGDARTFLAALLNLATATLQCAVTVTQHSSKTMPQMAFLTGLLNAAVGLLRYDLILMGSASKVLSPALPYDLLHLPAAADPSAPANLLKLYYSVGDAQQINDSHHGYHGYHGYQKYRPKVTMQLQWAFETPPAPLPWDTVFTMYSSGSNDFGKVHTTVAASTAQSLLQAMCSASSRLSELLQLHVEEMAADKRPLGAMDEERLKEGLLVSAALRVLANTSKVLRQCIPQGMMEIK